MKKYQTEIDLSVLFGDVRKSALRFLDLLWLIHLVRVRKDDPFMSVPCSVYIKMSDGVAGKYFFVKSIIIDT